MRIWIASLSLAIASLAVPTADGWAQARKPVKPVAKTVKVVAATPPSEPPMKQPPAPPPAPALVAKCADARNPQAPTKAKGGLRGLMGGVKTMTSAAFDTFSISGKDGVFTCTADTATKAQIARTPATTADGQKVRSLADQSDARGDMRPTLFTMPQTQKRLQAMVNRLADAWPYPDAPRPRVLISASMAFNAEARVDNTMTVWLGVFEGEDDKPTDDLTDNDLYWLLGHEYAHLAMDHARRDEVAQGQLGTMRQAISLYQRGVAFDARMHYAEPDASADMREKIDDSKNLHRNLRFAMNSVATPFWGRMQEDEADAIGYDLAALAGYQPRASYSIDKIGVGEKKMQDRFDAVASDVQHQMGDMLAEPRYQTALQQGQFTPWAKAVSNSALDTAWDGVKRQGKEWLERKHRSADARAEGLKRYREAAYTKAQITPTGGLITEEVKAITALPELNRGLSAARAASQARSALLQAKPDLEVARSKIAIALNTPQFSREAYVQFVAAQIDSTAGNPAAAIQHLEIARQSPNVSPEMYRELAYLDATHGRIPAARLVVEEGKVKSRDPDYFLPEDIRILARSHQFKDVPPLLETCRRTARDEVILDCMQAANDVDFSKMSAAQLKQFNDMAFFGATPKNAKGDTPRGQSTGASSFLDGLFSRP